MDIGKRFNVWHQSTARSKHPAVFPKALIIDHITSWSNPNDLILDPFMGSFTTATACKDLDRNFIGFELEEKYCQIGEKRLEQEILNF